MRRSLPQGVSHLAELCCSQARPSAWIAAAGLKQRWALTTGARRATAAFGSRVRWAKARLGRYASIFDFNLNVGCPTPISAVFMTALGRYCEFEPREAVTAATWAARASTTTAEPFTADIRVARGRQGQRLLGASQREFARQLPASATAALLMLSPVRRRVAVGRVRTVAAICSPAGSRPIPVLGARSVVMQPTIFLRLRSRGKAVLQHILYLSL